MSLDKTNKPENEVQDQQAAKQILTDFIEKHLPTLVLVGAEVVSASESEVVISAPLSKNYNDKGTAFGGSQYLLCIAASWGLTYLNAQAEGIEHPDLIGAEGTIKYLKPVKSDMILTRATADAEDMETFRTAIRDKQKARLIQHTSVEDVDTGKASDFQVKYVMFPV